MSDFRHWSVIKTIMEFMCGIQGYGKSIYKVTVDNTTYDELMSDPYFIHGEPDDPEGLTISSKDSEERFFKLVFKNHGLQGSVSDE